HPSRLAPPEPAPRRCCVRSSLRFHVVAALRLAQTYRSYARGPSAILPGVVQSRCVVRIFQTFSAKERPMLRRLTDSVKSFLKDEQGPTAVEYAVMLALIIVVCIAAITALGTNANATFTTVGNAVGGTSS